MKLPYKYLLILILLQICNVSKAVCDSAKINISLSPVCEFDSSKSIVGLPSGGSFSVIPSSAGMVVSGKFYPNSISTDISVIIRYTIAASGPCPSKSADSSFILYNSPDAPIAMKDSMVCENSAVNIFATGLSAGGVYTWKKPNGTTLSNVSNIDIPIAKLVPDHGIYSVFQTVNSCSSKADTIMLTVLKRDSIELDSAISPSFCHLPDGKIILKGLSPGVKYSVKYTNAVGLNVSRNNLISDLNGKIEVTSLSNGYYTNVYVQRPAAGCISNVINSIKIKGLPPPVFSGAGIFCK